MGLLGNQSQYQYYTDSSQYGNYQFVTLDSIIDAFNLIYVGEDKIISKISRADVQFHAMRAMQELTYDVFRSVKTQEFEVPNTLKLPLPQDYVNYSKVVRVGVDGMERTLMPSTKTSNPFAIEQDGDGGYIYDSTNTNLQEQFINAVGDDEETGSDTWDSFKKQTTAEDGTDATDVETDYRGRRYGLDPQYTNMHGTFYIDNLRGYIHFSSNLVGKTVTLKYVSDGLGTDSEMVIHKFCEEACYKWIMYGILSTRSGVPEGVLMRFKREKFTETRKAKIRLSNIKIEEFAQIIRGMGKQIK